MPTKYFILLVLITGCIKGLPLAKANPSEDEGKQLFRNNCAMCHSWDKEIQGPALGSILKKRPKEWLLPFIRNSQSMIARGDSNAVFLYQQYNYAVMPGFEELSEEQVMLILKYIQKMSENGIESNLSVPSRYDPLLDDPVALRGQRLFHYLCEGCHQLKHEVFGPALVSVTKRRPREWLVRFITNSQEVIKSGDPYAVHIYEQYEKKWMLPFNFLKRDEIEAILTYINTMSESPSFIQGVNGRKKNENTLPPYAERVNIISQIRKNQDFPVNLVAFRCVLIAITVFTISGSIFLLNRFSSIFTRVQQQKAP